MSRTFNNRRLKEDIIALRAEGKSYNQISKILNCSKSVISYHCGNGNEKQRALNYKKNKNTLNKCIMGKVNTFKSRHVTKAIKNKTSNFKRHSKSVVNNITEGNFTTQDVIDKIGENPKCYLTGKPIDLYKGKTYEFDHIIPVSLGGTNDLSNLQIATKEANQAKSSLTLEGFHDLCEVVLKHRDKQKLLEKKS